MQNQVFHSEGLKQHYQPIVDMSTQTVLAYEALLRPVDFGMSPDKLIQLFERNGKIPALDLWSIETAIGKASHLNDPPQVSVNVSGKSISDPAFVSRAIELVKQKPAHVLINFEVTETHPICDLASARRFLLAMQEQGSLTGLDDIGTGHASMAMAVALGFDFVKIPAAITTPMTAESLEVITDIVTIAEHHSMLVVAEHIDNDEQFKTIRALGVGYGQGWLFAKAGEHIAKGKNYAPVGVSFA